MNVSSTNPPPNYCKISGCPKQKVPPPDGQCYGICGGFNSMHPGGVSAVMADGSVHFISETIDYAVYQYLGNKQDGQAVAGF